jgi:hypothetical protein
MKWFVACGLPDSRRRGMIWRLGVMPMATIGDGMDGFAERIRKLLR